MKTAMNNNSTMFAQASAYTAEASSCCSCTAAKFMGIILGAIIVASIFVALIAVLSLRLLAVSIIVVGLVLVIMGQNSASPLCENS